MPVMQPTLFVPKTYSSLAFWFRFGAPGDGPPCILLRPLGIAGDWQCFPLRVLALQWSTYRGVWT
jgi:hypothetical protein